MKKIGFFGGSFNPPTIAHLEIVKLAVKEINLDKVIIIPMGDKYEKSGLIPFKHRYEMLKKMFMDYENIEISNMQENQKKRMYAIDNFKIIDEQFKDSKNFFIMGVDNFLNISKWKNPEYLLNGREYIVFKRDNIKINDNFENINFIDFKRSVSSTQARNDLQTGKNVENILTQGVIDYIKENELYKGDL